ncbi:hypothetical protein DL769_007911 [Monosporascus sp. CRB-8-3]|nr:hypothetical protein DL769_007911 [Monosporascus sp. CRB-8-3]
MPIWWEQTNNVPNTHPNAYASLTFSQFGQYNLTESLGIATNPDPANYWMTPNSLQTCLPYTTQQYNQCQTSPVPFDTFQNYGAHTNRYVPSTAPFPAHASMAFMRPPRHPLPLAQTIFPMSLPVSNASNVTPGDKQDPLVDQVGATTPHGNEIPQDREAATILAPHNIDPDETVCFGVLGGIIGKCEKPPSPDMSPAIQATLSSSETFVVSSDPPVRGHVASDHSFLLRDILESGVELHVSCSFETDNPAKSAATRKVGLAPCKLEIAIYAPFAMLQELREWSEYNEVYLQDPRFCLKDAKYCNPQRLSLHFKEPVMVSQVVSRVAEHRMHLRDITEDDDFLDKFLGSKIDLQETEQPSAVKTALKSHQKQALTFMLRRETGWAFQGPEADIWSIVDNANGRFYVNAISEIGSNEPPPQLHGGIIADPMGLGKTLTMIALAATDLHVFPGGLKLMRHHAKSRLTCLEDIRSVDVVLTTYHTVSAEWNERDPSSSLLFSVRWKRIVLDEAHIIRNETSRMAKAICNLESTCRWAVTGTPIQNHLNDLATLLKFIRAYPYDTRSRFELDISNYWKEGRDKEAATRLQRLSSCLLLRRPKATVQLPPRHNKEYPIEFTSVEREEYDWLKSRTATAIDEALRQGHRLGRSGAYANILQQIESLRLFCGLGLHYHSRHDDGSLASNIPTSWAAIAQHTFKTHLEMGSIQCSQCHAITDLTQSLFDDSTTQKPLYSRCLKFACAECSAKLARQGIMMDCGHNPSCPTTQVSTGIDTMEDGPDGQVPIPRYLSELPSKIAALVSDISSQPAHVKCVVFSTWRLTLNVAKAGLEQAGIQCLRFDGKVPQKDRHGILDSFKSDPLKRVLLLTLSCGAVGLTLTTASRAYLLEPHWNPTMEEQALGRIHRIGQDKEVTTIRFFIRDSFEEHVMDVQQSKKDLARVILSPHDTGKMDDSLERLQKLRSLL